MYVPLFYRFVPGWCLENRAKERGSLFTFAQPCGIDAVAEAAGKVNVLPGFRRLGYARRVFCSCPQRAEAQKIIETPWSSSAIPDFADPLTEGTRPPDLEKSLKFGAALFKAAAKDPAVHQVMAEVQHLLRPGSGYQAPEIADRIKAAMAAA
jgi:hypothetical protein